MQKTPLFIQRKLLILFKNNKKDINGFQLKCWTMIH